MPISDAGTHARTTRQLCTLALAPGPWPFFRTRQRCPAREEHALPALPRASAGEPEDAASC
eukprot:11185608-Lingulodinium_polyedra.AAC.1